MMQILAVLVKQVNSVGSCRLNSFAINSSRMKNEFGLEDWQVDDAARLKALFKEKSELSQMAFGARYEIGTQGMVWQYLNARRALNLDALLKFSRGLGVNPAQISQEIAKRLTLPEDKSALPGYQTVTKQKHHIPVVGKGMGGLPDRMFTDEGRPINGHDEYAELFSPDPAAFIIRVDGNSMWPKYIKHGYALVEPGIEPEIEDDVLLKTTTGEVMLKRLLSRRNGYLLGSYNDTTTYSYDKTEIVWMYYVAYPVPAKKIKSRI